MGIVSKSGEMSKVFEVLAVLAYKRILTQEEVIMTNLGYLDLERQ